MAAAGGCPGLPPAGSGSCGCMPCGMSGSRNTGRNPGLVPPAAASPAGRKAGGRGCSLVAAGTGIGISSPPSASSSSFAAAAVAATLAALRRRRLQGRLCCSSRCASRAWYLCCRDCSGMPAGCHGWGTGSTGRAACPKAASAGCGASSGTGCAGANAPVVLVLLQPPGRGENGCALRWAALAASGVSTKEMPTPEGEPGLDAPAAPSSATVGRTGAGHAGPGARGAAVHTGTAGSGTANEVVRAAEATTVGGADAGAAMRGAATGTGRGWAAAVAAGSDAAAGGSARAGSFALRSIALASSSGSGCCSGSGRPRFCRCSPACCRPHPSSSFTAAAQACVWQPALPAWLASTVHER